jgi:hypothetical protein
VKDLAAREMCKRFFGESADRIREMIAEGVSAAS